jgi:hypothetical protein
MKKPLNEEFRRMQLLAGVITESEYKEPTTMSPEMVVNSVSKLEDKIKNDPEINAFAASIASDPKKKQELFDLSKKLGINPLTLNENVEDLPKKLALMFAKKADNKIDEDFGNEDVTTAAVSSFAGLFGGPFAAIFLAEKFEMFTHQYVDMWGKTLTVPEMWVPVAGMAAGAIGGFILGYILQKVFEN